MTVCLLVLSVGTGQAQTFPLTLGRVNSLSAVRPSTLFVIATVDNENKYVVLSAQYRSDKRKMQGLVATKANESALVVNKLTTLWRFVSLDDGRWGIQSAETGGYLTRVSDDGADVKLLESPNANSAWTLIDSGDGLFVIASGEAQRRALTLSYSFDGESWDRTYGNYIASGNLSKLRLYGYGLKLGDSQGSQTVPQAGARLALCDFGRALGDDGNAHNVKDALLTDGTLAPTDGVAVWTCEPGEAGRFALRGSAGYLGYDLQTTGTPVYWQVVGGHYATCEAEPRYLCCDAEGRWLVKDAEDALGGEDAHFVVVADEPQRSLDDAGVCRLTGGWSATALSSLDWTGIRVLDLTAISLPQQARNFDAAPAQANVPTFVAAGEAQAVPADWRFVIAEGGKAAKLLRSVTLVDGAPFYTDRPFSVEAGQLTYRREATQAEGWQTLCLPFDVQASASETLATYSGADEGQPGFTAVTKLPAGTPSLVKRVAGHPLTLESTACTVTASPVARPATGLAGTFSPLRVDGTEGALYLLSAAKGSFVRAAAGSSLAPFRAYLLWNGAQKLPPRTLNVRLLTKKQD